MDLIEHISDRLQNGDDAEVAVLTQKALNQKTPATDILNLGLIAGMTIIGRKFKAHEIFLPDVLLAARAMYAGLDLLKPSFLDGDIPLKGRIVIGTVQGDLHDIGKNLVGIMLKGAGYDVIDLGNDVSPEKFVDTAVERDASLIGLSALLTTTMPIMRQVSELLQKRELLGKIKLIIGGAPITDDFARQIKAHGFGFDAMKAVDLVDRLIKE